MNFQSRPFLVPPPPKPISTIEVAELPTRSQRTDYIVTNVMSVCHRWTTPLSPSHRLRVCYLNDRWRLDVKRRSDAKVPSASRHPTPHTLAEARCRNHRSNWRSSELATGCDRWRELDWRRDSKRRSKTNIAIIGELSFGLSTAIW